VVTKFPSKILPRLVGLIGNSGAFYRGEKAPRDWYVACSGKTNRDSGLSEECGNTGGSVRIGFQFVATLLIVSRPFLEIAKPAPSAAELFSYSGHGGGDVLHRLVNVGGQRSTTSRNAPELRGKECLAYTRITMDIEQEPAPLIINEKCEILPVLDHRPLPADETALLTFPDAILERSPLTSH